jgi:Abortive infection C-terminus
VDLAAKARQDMHAAKKKARMTEHRLVEPLRKCLAMVLESELNGKPLPFEQYRAQNPKKVPLLEALTSQRLIKRDTSYTVTFWGLIQARTRAAGAMLRNSEKVYRTLGQHYREHQYAPLSLNELQRRTGLTSQQVIQCVLFLERSPFNPAIGPEWQSIGVVATEYYVTNSFAALKALTRDVNRNLPTPVGPILGQTEHLSLTADLDVSESEAVRESWKKAVTTVSSDPAGSITAARSLMEAACRHILADHGVTDDGHGKLPKLYKDAAARLGLASTSNLNDALRRLLGGCATVVEGLGEFRNVLGDSHGKGPHSLRPARRHASLAVSLAGGMAAFLLATLDAQRRP